MEMTPPISLSLPGMGHQVSDTSKDKSERQISSEQRGEIELPQAKGVPIASHRPACGCWG
jgi:hypothetical protein